MVLSPELHGVHVQLFRCHIDDLLHGVLQRQVADPPHTAGGHKVSTYAGGLVAPVLASIEVGSALEGVRLEPVSSVIEVMPEVACLDASILRYSKLDIADGMFPPFGRG